MVWYVHPRWQGWIQWQGRSWEEIKAEIEAILASQKGARP